MLVVCVGMGGVTVILEWQNPKPDPVGVGRTGALAQKEREELVKF